MCSTYQQKYIEREADEDVLRGVQPGDRLAKHPRPRSELNFMSHEIELFTAEIGDVPTLDLHEMSVDIAIHELETFIDRAFVRRDEAVKIIHGRGSGKMRDAVHAWLKKHPTYIGAYRDAHTHGQIGGVTVVALNAIR